MWQHDLFDQVCFPGGFFHVYIQYNNPLYLLLFTLFSSTCQQLLSSFPASIPAPPFLLTPYLLQCSYFLPPTLPLSSWHQLAALNHLNCSYFLLRHILCKCPAHWVMHYMWKTQQRATVSNIFCMSLHVSQCMLNRNYTVAIKYMSSFLLYWKKPPTENNFDYGFYAFPTEQSLFSNAFKLGALFLSFHHCISHEQRT